MREHIDHIAALHAVVGVLLFLGGGAVLGLSILLDAYSVYDYVAYLGRLLPGARPTHYWYPTRSLLYRTLVFTAGLSLPALAVMAFGALEMGLAWLLRRRSPRARQVAFVAALPELLLCFMGMAMAAVTVVLVCHADVREEFHGGVES